MTDASAPSATPPEQMRALRVFCADAYPGLKDECIEAVRAIRPDNMVRLLQLSGCAEVNSHSGHWPCVLPQHGPAGKHTRKIALEAWQQEIVAEFTRKFIRGLVHSDGSRSPIGSGAGSRTATDGTNTRAVLHRRVGGHHGPLHGRA